MTRGTYYRWGAKVTVESLASNRLDVRELARAGWLWPGSRWPVRLWRYGKFETIEAEALGADWDQADSLRLDGRTVYLDRTRCTFGGDRPWFRCPDCDRRVALLYSDWGGWRCRHCLGLTYQSRTSPAWVNELGKALDLEGRLEWVRIPPGGDLAPGRYPVKPKGMHWRTFGRLWRECYRANDAAIAAMQLWEDRQRAELERDMAKLARLERLANGR